MPEAQESFDHRKVAFISTSSLTHTYPSQLFILETDASSVAIGAARSQRRDLNQGVYPCAYCSGKLTPAECNYEILDKEQLAIKAAFQAWRHYLEGARHPVQVFANHKNLEYLCSAKALTQRQSSTDFFISGLRVHYRVNVNSSGFSGIKG
ncbi:unnamed protein product [Natator depressus]